MISLLIFDFDGTLVNSKNVVVELLNDVSKKYGLSLDNNFFHHLGDENPLNMIKNLGFNNKKILEIVKEIEIALLNNYGKIRLNKGVKELEKIKIPKVILSNSPKEYIEKILLNNDIKFFDEIYGSDDFENKKSKMKKIIKKYNVKSKKVLYVDDRAIGVLLAKKFSCLSVAVSNKYSWSERRELIESNPDFLIKNIADIVKIVKKLNLD